MDISDKNFKPCPCGYQICQFCYNNIRQNPELNGRCPGCRRLYDDESVEYKTISADEYRIQQAKREKRDREKKQREKEKKDAEMLNKKHLAGLRVVQKNLVYVTGLNPPCPAEDLHSILRSDKYFGQYGKISKIVINKKNPNSSSQPSSSSGHHNQSAGLVVYVTFARKEDALKCINELDGSLCDGRVLRAAHGTTKYCSSYLRGHPCPNPNCMFLHEPGEEADSYTRKDLSTQQGIKMGMMGVSGNNNITNNNRMGSGVHTAFSSNHSNPNSSFGENDDTIHDHTNDEDNDDNHPFQPHNTVPILPPTANWAKDNNSDSNSPLLKNNIPLANSAAFPTLGEIFKEQKNQQQVKIVKQKGKSSKAKENLLLPDDIDVDDDSSIDFIEYANQNLNNLIESKNKLKVHFSKFEEDNGKDLPLFAFNKNLPQNQTEDIKEISRQIIERYILKPIKNYHLAYQNHPITQLLQQQQQQRQQQTHSALTAQISQLPLDQKKSIETQKTEPSTQQLHAQQQAQQQLLLLQLQQQQQQQQQHQQQQHQQQLQQQYHQQQLQQMQQQHHHSQHPQHQLQHHLQQPQQPNHNQINMLRANERTNTSTPPPPGLFTGVNSTKANILNHTGQYNSSNSQIPENTTPALDNPSSSSQLLTQLMSGKR